VLKLAAKPSCLGGEEFGINKAYHRGLTTRARICAFANRLVKVRILPLQQVILPFLAEYIFIWSIIEDCVQREAFVSGFLRKIEWGKVLVSYFS
jgi:hypothetical protein